MIRPVDAVGLTLFAGFGLWWVLAPTSVIRFYARLRGSYMAPATPRGVRLAGVVWCLLVIVIVWLQTHP